MISGQDRHTIGLLDLLVLVAQNLKALVGWSLAAGIVAYAATLLIPVRYVSHAILALPSDVSGALGPVSTVFQTQTPVQAAALMTSAVVLDPVIEKLQLTGKRPLAEVRLRLADKVKANVATDGFLHLMVLDDDPAQAIAISNAIIDFWRKTTVPAQADRTDLSSRLAYSKESLAAVGQILRGLAADGGVSLKQPLTRGDTGATIVTVGQLQSQYLNDVMILPRLINGMSRDVVRQEPTLVLNMDEPKRGLIAISVAVSVAILILAVIFIRRAWQMAAQDAQSSPKLKTLVAALPFARAAHE